jgi:hemerythrin-like domain-containing protein
MSRSRICQTLHEEHEATVAFAECLEAILGKYPHGHPDRADPAMAGILRQLPFALGAGLQRHFDFEEARLFTLLASAGDSAIVAHLTDEHETMRLLCKRLLALGGGALAEGFGDASWPEFRAVAAELCGELLMHVQKEEMALLPLLEEALDPRADAILYDVYAGNAGEMTL